MDIFLHIRIYSFISWNTEARGIIIIIIYCIFSWVIEARRNPLLFIYCIISVDSEAHRIIITLFTVLSAGSLKPVGLLFTVL